MDWIRWRREAIELFFFKVNFMICKLTNNFINGVCSIIAYGEENRKSPIPDKEVSIRDFIIAGGIYFLSLIFIASWWVPCIWITKLNIWRKIDNVLTEKRFKCGKK